MHASHLHAELSRTQSLVRAWKERRDQTALHDLVASQMPILRAWARRSQSSRDDLVNEGVIALLEALERYPLNHTISFEAHAYPAMRGAILRARAQSTVSIPERKLRDAYAGRMSAEKAAHILNVAQTSTLDDSHDLPPTPAAEESFLLQERERQLRRALARALRSLTREERRLVVHHLLKEDIALETLAEGFNISLTRARSLEGRALIKMRNALILNGFMMADFQ